VLTAEPVNVPSVSPLFDVVVVEEVAPTTSSNSTRRGSSWSTRSRPTATPEPG
jgi:hypothetical protein